MSTAHYNRTTEKRKRRALRALATSCEQRLWRRLRGQQLGIKFRRQYSVDQYILDFYAPARKLAIEIDGESHYVEGAEEYDRRRSEHLRGYGIEVLRFTNADVLRRLSGVLDEIRLALRRRGSPLPPPGPLLGKEGDLGLPLLSKERVGVRFR